MKGICDGNALEWCVSDYAVGALIFYLYLREFVAVVCLSTCIGCICSFVL